jgi:hypothetical protein
MSNGSSTGNLNRHLKKHPDKTNTSTAKQAEFMKKFIHSDGNIVVSMNLFIYFLK